VTLAKWVGVPLITPLITKSWRIEMLRRLHAWIVKSYTPDDNQIELANALFNWKHK
jgi:hypothetical protein